MEKICPFISGGLINYLGYEPKLVPCIKEKCMMWHEKSLAQYDKTYCVFNAGGE